MRKLSARFRWMLYLSLFISGLVIFTSIFYFITAKKTVSGKPDNIIMILIIVIALLAVLAMLFARCPMSLDITERALWLWSNPGDTVFSPFAGIGSELYMALQMDRKALGIELKPSYFRQAVINCKEADASTAKQVGLNF